VRGRRRGGTDKITARKLQAFFLSQIYVQPRLTWKTLEKWPLEQKLKVVIIAEVKIFMEMQLNS